MLQQTAFIASDHHGFNLKEQLKWRFKQKIAFEDLGVFAPEPVFYPIVAKAIAQKVAEQKGNTIGVLIGKNSFELNLAIDKNVKPATLFDEDSARNALAKKANLVCLGTDHTNEMLAVRLIDIFFKTENWKKKKNNTTKGK